MHPLEEQIGYKFRNSLLLAEALTHSSLRHETQQTIFDNQRLEYLGDAVLQLLVADSLYRRFPTAAEGRLSKARARLVSGENLATYARQIRLGEHLLIGPGDERSGGRDRTTTLGDAFEALVGAMYLDGGLEVARRFVLTYAEEQLAAFQRQPPTVENPKGDLQEILQSLAMPVGADPTAPRNPLYRIVGQSGPDHAKCFTAEVHWGGLLLGGGTGRSKWQAETAAAVDALENRCWLVTAPVPDSAPDAF